MKIRVLALAVLGGAAPALAAADSTPALAGQAPAAGHAYDVAIATYKAQIRENPNDAVAHNKLGICYQNTNKLKLARKEYEKATELNPEYAGAWNNLGTLEHARRKYAKAVTYYRRALELNPGSATFYRNIGAAWLAAGRLPLAVAAYEEALRLDPGNLEAATSAGFAGAGVEPSQLYFAYAKLFAARGDLESAFMWLSKAHDQGFRDFSRVAGDADFAGLVKDPRYLDLSRY